MSEVMPKSSVRNPIIPDVAAFVARFEQLFVDVLSGAALPEDDVFARADFFMCSEPVFLCGLLARFQRPLIGCF